MKKTRFLIAYVLLGLGAIYLFTHEDIAVPMNTPFSQFPASHAGWEMIGQSEFSESVLAALRPADYLYRQYVNERRQRVDLYIGYHSGGKDSGPIHSPRHCLPGSGWFPVSSEQRELETPAGPVHIAQILYKRGEQSELFLYWFQVRDRSMTSEYALRLTEISNSLLYRRRDTSFIRISVPVQTQTMAQAQETAERFIQDFYPVILTFLPE
jgi:EpsI family protein